MILVCDSTKLDPNDMMKYRELLKRKVTQDKLKQERKHQQILINVKDILLQIVLETQLTKKAPIIDQLVSLVNQVNAPNVDAEERMMRMTGKKG